ncbi:MAG: methionine adenosyltransferase, partial [Thermoprotei archaeon]
VVDYKVGQGSADLIGIYELGKMVPLANDTSFGASFAPLSTLERLVFETERLLNSDSFKKSNPEVGEDVKVMGLRIGKTIKLTVATAMISRHIPDKDHYIAVKESVKEKVLDLASRIASDYNISVDVNAADKPEHDIFYITVTGTSAEHGDDGMTGRGNRVNGLITPMRPMSLEATAGKNPVSHVGKVYNVLAHEIAERIYKEVKDVKEVYVGILSQIGKPINEPQVVDIKITPYEKLTMDMKRDAEEIANDFLERIRDLTSQILKGEVLLF